MVFFNAPLTLSGSGEARWSKRPLVVTGMVRVRRARPRTTRLIASCLPLALPVDGEKDEDLVLRTVKRKEVFLIVEFQNRAQKMQEEKRETRKTRDVFPGVSEVLALKGRRSQDRSARATGKKRARGCADS